MDEGGKEPTGIGGADDSGMLGRSDKGEACTFTLANQCLLLCLLEKGKESFRIMQIVGYDVLESWREGGDVLVFFALLFSTSRVARRGVLGDEEA